MALRVITKGLLLLLLCGGVQQVDAGARGAAAVRKQAESSLRVSGEIVLRPDGSVLSHTLDPQAPLGEPLSRFVGDAVGNWRFKPVLVDGKPATVKVPMSLRLVAKPADDGKINVSIASTHFGSKDDVPATDNPRSVQMNPPRFPKNALYMGGKGTVYLVVQIGRDGKVANVDAEQVNLRVAGTENQMAMLRKQFTMAAVNTARGWTFDIPTTGETANDKHWLVRVPVEFVLTGPGEKKSNKSGWDTYIPGPRNIAMPWAQEQLRTAGSPDALPDAGIYPLREGAELLTPPTT